MPDGFWVRIDLGRFEAAENGARIGMTSLMPGTAIQRVLA